MSVFTGTISQLLSGAKVDGATILAWAELLQTLSDPWSSYVPSWSASGTQPAIGNGTKTGSYIQAGKLVVYQMVITIGSTTTFGTGAYSFGLPVANFGGAMVPVGLSTIFDTSATTTFTRDGWTGTNTVALTDQSGNRVTSAVPMTFATGDVIQVAGVYQAS